MKRTLLLSTLIAALLVPAPALAASGSARSITTSGHVSTDMHTQIAGGAVGSVPGVVAISTASQYCTGAVIAPKIVLTAAHCLTDAGSKSSIEVRVNGTHRNLSVARYIKAPGFNSTTHENDAALLILKSATTAPVLRVLGAAPAAGTGAMITGYGQHTYTSTIANVAYYADTTVQSHAACQAAWAQFGSAVPNTDICAGNSPNNATLTRGDSGGPLLVKTADGHWGIAGINDLVVIPNNVYDGAIPQAFGRVDKIRPWIQSQIARVA